MIAKKYTDNNDNPAIKVLASSAGRQWVGTETALDAALAAGTIKPGTVADTYMELDEPTVDYATVEYVRKNNKLSQLSVWGTDLTVADTNSPSGSTTFISNAGTALYDGFWMFQCSIYNNFNFDFNVRFEASNDGGSTWFPYYVLGWVPRTGIPGVMPVTKGTMYRVSLIVNQNNEHLEYHTAISCLYYKERDYSE
jgi:hypothetical protein